MNPEMKEPWTCGKEVFTWTGGPWGFLLQVIFPHQDLDLIDSCTHKTANPEWNKKNQIV